MWQNSILTIILKKVYSNEPDDRCTINHFFIIFTLVDIGLDLDKGHKVKHGLPKPNCCSRRIPIKTKLNMFTIRWITPACNQIQLTSLHPWCWCTILSQSRAPNFFNLQRWNEIKDIPPVITYLRERAERKRNEMICTSKLTHSNPTKHSYCGNFYQHDCIVLRIKDGEKGLQTRISFHGSQTTCSLKLHYILN